jgi:site-specific DNA recombinase
MSNKITPPTVLATPGGSTLVKGAQLMKSVPQTPKRAVLYARVSTEEQAKGGYSLGEQVRRLKEHAEGQSMEIVREPFVDEGYSGRSMERPGLRAIRELARASEIDVILVSNWDRLFRNAGYQAAFISEMSALGVTLTSLDGQDNDTAEGKLFNQIQAGFAEYFRDRIITNMRIGKQGRARSGKVVPGRSAPLGFEYLPEVGNYRVVPERMIVARRIFEAVGVRGESMHSLKIRFEAEGIPPPSYERNVKAGREPTWTWHIPTIRRIIENDAYLGTSWFNRARVEKNPDTQNGNTYISKANPKKDWIAVPVPDSGIPPEWIEAARKRILNNIRPANAGRRDWILKGLLKCECGVRLTAFTGQRERFYYVCSRHRRDGNCPYFHYFPAVELEHRIKRVVLDLIRRPKIMLERVQKAIDAQREEVEDASTQISVWAGVLEKAAQKRARYQEMAATGLMTLEELRPKLEVLDKETAQAEAELERLSEPEKALADLEIIPETVESYISGLPEFAAGYPSALRSLYRDLHIEVLARKNGSLLITGAFGQTDLAPDDPGPFIGIRATRELDAEAYTWTEIPPPDDPFWDTWVEGDPVREVERRSKRLRTP